MTDAIDRTVRDHLHDEADLTERVPVELDALTIPVPRQPPPPPTTGPWPVVRARGTRTVRAVAAPPPVPPPRASSRTVPPPIPAHRASSTPAPRRTATLPPPLAPRRAASGTSALPIVRGAPAAAPPAGDTSTFASWLVRDSELVVPGGAAMFEPVESVPVRRTPRTPRWYYVVAIEALAVVAIVTTVIVLVVRRDADPAARPPARATEAALPSVAPAAPSVAPPPAVAPAEATPLLVTPTAAIAPSEAAPLVVPAPVVEAAPVPSRPSTPPRRPARRHTRHRVATASPAAAHATPRTGQGTLVVSTTPPCEIAIDGKRTRLRTPQRAIALAAGTHRITLTNTVTHVARTIAVTVAPGKTTKLVRDFSR